MITSINLIAVGILGQTNPAPTNPAPAAVPAAPVAAPTAAPSMAAAPESPGMQGLVPNQPGNANNTGTVQPGGNAPGTAPAGPRPASPFDNSVLFIMLGMVGLMIFMSWRTSKKDKARRMELMSSLATGDKILTTGGVIGTIVELRDDEVVLRVDEVTNTRIRFSRLAIASIMAKGRSGSSTVTEAKPNGAGQKSGV